MPISAEMSSAAKVSLRLLKEGRPFDLLSYSSEIGKDFIGEIIANGNESFFRTPAGLAILSWEGSIENYFMMADKVTDVFINIKFNEYTDPDTKTKYDCFVQLQTNILRPPVKYLFHKILLEEHANSSIPSATTLSSSEVSSVAASFRDMYANPRKIEVDDMEPHSKLLINTSLMQSSPYYPNSPIKPVVKIVNDPYVTSSGLNHRKKYNVFASNASTSDYKHIKSLLTPGQTPGPSASTSVVPSPHFMHSGDSRGVYTIGGEGPNSFQSEGSWEGLKASPKNDEDAYFSMYPGNEEEEGDGEREGDSEAIKRDALSALSTTLTGALKMAKLLKVTDEDLISLLKKCLSDMGGMYQGSSRRDDEKEAMMEKKQAELMLSVLNSGVPTAK